MSDTTRDAFAVIGVMTMLSFLVLLVWVLANHVHDQRLEETARREAATSGSTTEPVYMPVRELRPIQAERVPLCDLDFSDPKVQQRLRHPEWHVIIGGRNSDGGEGGAA